MKAKIPVAWLLAALYLSSCGGTNTSQYVPPPPNAPSGLNYPDPNMFTQGVTITPLVPTVKGTPIHFTVEPDLPPGLRLNADGSISGTPTEPRATTTYSVTAGNSEGSSSFGVRISVAGRYAVGGVVTGLTGTGLVLTNNGIDPLAVSANGAFRFSILHPAGARYAMQIDTQPSGQSCSIADGTGALANSDYGNAVVTCSASTNKATRSVNTFDDIVEKLASNTSGRVLYLTCREGSAPHSIHGVVVDPLTAAFTPLGEAIHQ